MIFFNCEIGKFCNSCLDIIDQKKRFSMDTILLKGKPVNECYQAHIWLSGEYFPLQNNHDFESAKNSNERES